ncbi:hypothetical protein [Chryseobacterium wanjuense]
MLKNLPGNLSKRRKRTGTDSYQSCRNFLGSAIGGITSASLDIAVSGILNGTLNYTPTFTMGVVDVRDVADIHIKAMLSLDAAGERFIATADGVMSFYDVAELFKKKDRNTLQTFRN